MNVLVLCNKPPFPPKEGGPIAMNAVISGLIDSGVSVKILSVNSNKYNVNLEDIPEEYVKKTGIEFVDLDLTVKKTSALRCLLFRRSYNIQRFVSKAFEKKLIDILKNGDFDIVQIELLHLSPYVDVIRRYSKAKIVLRAHNVEYLIWERLLKEVNSPIKKFYLKHITSTLKRYELSVINKYDLILPITGKDAMFFKKNTNVPVCVLPFGIDVEKYKKYAEDENVVSKRSLFHLGSMDYQPNIEAIEWFLNNVWDRGVSKIEGMELYLAGRNMPDWLLAEKGGNLHVEGAVESAEHFMLENGIMIVPLLSGSGIRIKIIEGMALGKVVITTEIGAEGIDYENGKNILIANNPDDFKKVISNYYGDADAIAEIGNNAREYVFNNHNNRIISKKLLSLYNKII